jgi:hypothetical protein
MGSWISWILAEVLGKRWIRNQGRKGIQENSYRENMDSWLSWIPDEVFKKDG